jgi:fatty acid desaturase
MANDDCLAKGFKIENPATKAMIRTMALKSPTVMVGYILGYWLTIGGTAVAVEDAAHFLHPVIAATIYLPAVIWIARSMRALECTIHEFAHYALSKNLLLNDAIGSGLIALPLATTIEVFRASHNDPHHVYLSVVGVDPDLRRYDDLDAHNLDRSSWQGFAREVAARLPRYVIGWSRLTTGSWTLVLTLLWHAVVLWLPFYAFYGEISIALSKWALYWVIPQLVVLPVIRFIGETGKHDYSGGTSVAAVTISNIGPVHKLLIHPFGDGHHTLHHLFANVPGYRLGKLHRWLMANEPGYRKSLRYRLRVLEQPRSGLEA